MEGIRLVWVVNLKRLLHIHEHGDVKKAADATGIPIRTLHHWLDGHIAEGKNMAALTSYLGCPEADLFVDHERFMPRAGISPLEALEIIRQAIQENISKPPAQIEKSPAVITVPHYDELPDFPRLLENLKTDLDLARSIRNALYSADASRELTEERVRETPKRVPEKKKSDVV